MYFSCNISGATTFRKFSMIDNLIAEIEESESEDDKKEMSKSQNAELPTELSIDCLLLSRKNQPRVHRSLSFPASAEEDKEEGEKLFQEPMELGVYKLLDGNIFKSRDYHFSDRFFEILHIEIPDEILSPCELPPGLKATIQYHPDLLNITPNYLFAYAHYITVNNILDSDLILYRLSQILEPSSLSYKLWREYFVYALKNSYNAVFSLFSICNFFLFKFDSEEDSDRARYEVYLLYFSMISCTDFIHHRQFSSILHQIRSCLIDADFDQSQVNYVVGIMCDIAFEVPIEMIASIVSYFPLDGVGSILINHFSIKMIFSFFGLDDPDLNIDNLAQEIYRIKAFCESEDEELLKTASAVLALSERALISSFRLTHVKGTTVSQMIHALRFSLQNTDPGMLTLLKEQIHFTRTQFETLIQSDFGSAPASQILL
ncbi:hypothetical protein TRFO_38055 [Tritrichomonas foetus]|uniref:Uncharacterized protein n=1 Tax=Tritrichomonas foetus TaxID=1144522 RepID=A0A1J4J9H9_9EUKA|nr:hypothetical protein TRFO_38055 [Tritrichomonas foetus]|eukprot:OHS95808.1 hypothetical protein TRFO_38055 [Tritrichomonas foetus]